MKIPKENAIKIFEADIEKFQNFDKDNILNSEFIARLKTMIKEEKEKRQPEYDELKKKKETEQLQILQEVDDLLEVYIWSVECNSRYIQQKDILDRKLKEKIEKNFYPKIKSTIGKILLCAIIHKIRISVLDESLEEIISSVNKKLNIYIALIEKECIIALEVGESYSVKSKLSKHYKKALEMILATIPNFFVEFEILCKEDVLEYVQKNKSEFIKKIVSKIKKEEDKELFNLYFGLTNQKPKSFTEISELTNRSIIMVTNNFKNVAKCLKANLHILLMK